MSSPAPGDDHAGRTVAALHRAHFEESFLQRMQLAVHFQAFDGGDLSAGGGTYFHAAGMGGQSIYQDRAGAALTFAATVLGSGQIEVIAQDAEQRSV